MISTKDVSLAAFLRYKGHMLVEYKVNGRGRRRDGEWVFDIPADQFEKLKVEYVNSEFAAFEGIRRGMTKQKFS